MGCISTKCEKYYSCKLAYEDGTAINWAGYGTVTTRNGDYAVDNYCGKYGAYALYEPMPTSDWNKIIKLRDKIGVGD